MDAHIKQRMTEGDMSPDEGYRLGQQLADAILDQVAADPDEFQRRLDDELKAQREGNFKPT